ncbi:single-stranded DNA-binding protein [Wolbachia endosymbiont of Atemnus politus]|uniref:single-stranded DNA-binding protein n=1 Tax=Wolbachia endosymbiont of Atemnus politus TaxID=2682840 RepID=UPI0015733B8B|nr:single-stranded DNA-binding protein [Wolbachia endosymbiont of Atemnus politus]NSM57013.1 single-stranded DNA-binding protein [Wolbachia endosymbiont of Atemnus politus]NSX83163.1 single-stranded DNA-binding protein [Wolbachia endosymbiont of Atemnus politus]
MSNGTVNKVILIGNLGRDPEIRTMQNGKEMANFSIATSESWTDKFSGVRSEKTEWHNIVVFNEGLVKVVKDFARKGSKVYIEGSLRTRKWTDQNGSERYTTEVMLQNFNSVLTLLDSRNSTSNSDYQPNEYKQNKTEQKNQYENFDSEIKEELIDDEIPF